MPNLFHSVDNNSIKTEKYVEHGTAIIKLVPVALARVLRAFARADD